jgi:hypothetical protein
VGALHYQKASDALQQTRRAAEKDAGVVAAYGGEGIERI